MLERANSQIRDLTGRVNRIEPENARLRSVELDYGRLRRHFANERTDEILCDVKAQEIEERKYRIKHRVIDYTR